MQFRHNFKNATMLLSKNAFYVIVGELRIPNHLEYVGSALSFISIKLSELCEFKFVGRIKN
jgi:hypothetical protein